MATKNVFLEKSSLLYKLLIFQNLKNREIAFFEFLKIWTSSKIAKLKKVRFAKKSKLKKSVLHAKVRN